MRVGLTAILTLFLPAVGAGGDGEARFWVLRLPGERYPVQEQVVAKPVYETESFVLFLAQGQTLPAENRLPSGGLPAVLGQLEVARNRLLKWQGAPPPPKVVVLVWDNPWPEAAWFSPFDLMGEEKALTYGYHANPGPVLVAAFPYAGSQAWANTAALVEAYFLAATLPPDDPFPTAMSRSAARWFAYRVGAAPPRVLWGHQEPHRPGPSSWSPASDQGWGPLLVEYLAQTLGPHAAAELARRQNAPQGALASVFAAYRPDTRPEDALAAFWPALWQAPWPQETAPENPLASAPRPELLAWTVGSRPASGQASVGVGGGGLFVVEGDGSPPLPLALLGDPGGRWVGAMQKASPWGLGPLQPVVFDGTGAARVEVPTLAAQERLLVFVGVLPHPSGEADHRFLTLQWGLAWSPRASPNRVQERLRDLAFKRFGEATPALRARVTETLKVLGGLAPPRGSMESIASRYAWSPQAGNVVGALIGEAEKRGLAADREAFLRTTPWGTTAEWENVVIRLPGSSPRRLPLVLAAHWDATASDPWLAFRSARGIRDNALGVVTALETAALLARRPRNITVEVAFLAGGCHDAAGAQAFLASRQGKVAVWMELEKLWSRDAADPAKLVVRLGDTTSLVVPRLPPLFRRWGLAVDLAQDPPPAHTGSALAAGGGAVTITFSGPNGGLSAPWPPEAELANASPEYVLLLAEALADLISAIGGQ